MERCVVEWEAQSGVATSIDVGIALEQQLCRLPVLMLGCMLEWSGKERTAWIDVGAVVEQELQHFWMSEDRVVGEIEASDGLARVGVVMDEVLEQWDGGCRIVLIDDASQFDECAIGHCRE